MAEFSDLCSRVLRYDNGKLQVVQEVDGKDKVGGGGRFPVGARF